jgi:ATP-dependent exoDNAse (exonuclease V) beta subunit
MASSKGNRNRKRSTPSGQKQRRPLPLAVLFAEQGSSAASEGTLLHRWLQNIGWLEKSLPAAESLVACAGGLDLPAARLRTLAEEFRGMLQSPMLSSLLSRDSGPDSSSAVLDPHLRGFDPAAVELSVRSEFPFACEASGELINGCIDRLVLCLKDGVPIAADVIDFKSDELPQQPRAVADRVDFYRGQMQTYRQAVSKLLMIPIEKVTTRIAFLKIGQVAIVDAAS